MTTETIPIQTEPEADTSRPGVSLSQAAARIGINRQYLKGFAEATGVRLIPIGPSLVMSRRDFERIRERLADRDGAVIAGR